MINKGLLSCINGIDFVSSEYMPIEEPVIQLSNKVTVSESFRANCNRLYAKCFGYRPVVYVINGKMIAHPQNLEKIKRAIENAKN